MIDYSGKIIVIAGPSASGKSNLATKLAKELDGYIINGDSRQLYKHLTIGSAKPTAEEISKSGIRHFLYDIIDPKENFTIYQYQKEVENILNSEKGIPIIVGGTGLYIDSVIFNYNLVQSNSNEDLSSLSLEQLQEKAKEYLNDMTESDRKNRHRLIRAIQKNGIKSSRGKELDNIYFVLDIPKYELEERVRDRIEEMFKRGLLDENKKLLEMGYTYEDKGMKSIGYSEFKPYFEGLVSLENVKEMIVKNTLSYIKRQKTWFRRNKNSIWVDSYENIFYLASNFIKGK